MPALNTDLVRNAAPNFATTLANSMLVSDTSMTLQAATGLPTATAITLVIDATDPVSGLATPTLKEVMTGTLSGTTVSNLLRGQDSTTAQGHASGANVVMWITANLWNDFQTSYLVGHTQLGAHISNLPLTSPKITTGINDSNNIKVLGITATSSAVNQLTLADAATNNNPSLTATGTDSNIGINLATKGTGVVQANGNPVWQYLGHNQITANSTTSSSTPVVGTTQLAVAVTIPTGVTKVKVTIYAYTVFTNNAAGAPVMWLYSGATAGTLTTNLQQALVPNTAGGTDSRTMIWVSNSAPTPGAVAYTLALSNTGSDLTTLGAAAATPAFILVECC